MIKGISLALVASVAACGPSKKPPQVPALPLAWTLQVDTHPGGCLGCKRGYRLRITSDGTITYFDGQLDKFGAFIDSRLSHDETWGIFWKLSEAHFFLLDDRIGRFGSHATSMDLTFSVLDRERTVQLSGTACRPPWLTPRALCRLEAELDAIARRFMGRRRSNKR